MNVLTDFQTYAQDLLDTHKIPGVSLAVWHKQELHQAAAGLLNVDTAVEATTDSIFQIGSVTKTMTASLLLLLVDEGRIDLDKPVRHYLRDFAIADAQATQTITVRQLLNHTNGIAGDFFPEDPHSGDNPIARYVDRCYQLPMAHPVGEYCAYSNAAFVIAGRVIEVVTGGSWFDAMNERIFQPLGMSHAISRPMDTLRFRAAMGHFPDPGNPSHWQLSKETYLPVAAAPAGATVSMSAADLVTFGRAHLNKGVSLSGAQWMSEDAIVQMQRHQIEIPALSASPVATGYMGLGWQLQKVNSNNRIMFGHAGGTFGQESMLKMVPDQDLCIAVFINGQKEGVVNSITATLLKELADIDLSEPESTFIRPSEQELARYCGTYASLGDRYTFKVEAGQLIVDCQDLIINGPAQRYVLKPIDQELWYGYSEKGSLAKKLRFLNADDKGFYACIYTGRILLRT